MSVTGTFKKKTPRKQYYLRSFLIAVLVFANSLNLPVSANSVTYSVPTDNQGAGFMGEVPVKQIGPLLLPKAVVQFRDTDVNVLAVPDWLFDRNVVLSGALVKAQVDIQGKSNNLRGLVYFMDGQWLANLGSGSSVDVVDTISGDKLHGRIRSRLDNGFAFKPETGPMQKLLFSEIKSINSPRAYVFTITSSSTNVIPNTSIEFDMANAITFAPTFSRAYAAKEAKLPKSTLAGTEPGISKSDIALLTGVNLIVDFAPAVAIPLALNRTNTREAQRTINLFQSEQSRAAGIPVPLNYSTSAP